MIITSQGFGHFTEGLNNQDFGMETPRMLLVLDGCSGAKYSEAGVRLFAQLFSRKEDYDSVEKFEENVKSVFDDIIALAAGYYKTPEELETDFIMENLLFTIIACFQTEKEYIVKLFGDGYIVTQNKEECISYMKFAYGKCPPYFAYRYCQLTGGEFKAYDFKTFRFDKTVFPRIAIASDGIMPIAKGDVGGLDDHLLEANKAYAEILIKSNRKKFNDDITIATFEYIPATKKLESSATKVAAVGSDSIETGKVSVTTETGKCSTSIEIATAQTVESRAVVIETDKVSATMETAKPQTTEETLGGAK